MGFTETLFSFEVIVLLSAFLIGGVLYLITKKWWTAPLSTIIFYQIFVTFYNSFKHSRVIFPVEWEAYLILFVYSLYFVGILFVVLRVGMYTKKYLRKSNRH